MRRQQTLTHGGNAGAAGVAGARLCVTAGCTPHVSWLIIVSSAPGLIPGTVSNMDNSRIYLWRWEVDTGVGRMKDVVSLVISRIAVDPSRHSGGNGTQASVWKCDARLVH